MSDKTKTPAPCPVDKALRVAEAYCYDAGAANAARGVKEARAKVAELVAADRELSAIEEEIRRDMLAGPRPNSRGTGWEIRDAEAREERKRRAEAAHARRDAALAKFGEVK